MDASEVADFMRGLGFYPTDYENECLRNELQICGKRKVPFENLVKLFVNHARRADSSFLEASMRTLLDSPTSELVEKSKLVAILTDESAEGVDAKNAETYLKVIFREKLFNEISLSDFVHKVTSDGNACIA